MTSLVEFFVWGIYLCSLYFAVFWLLVMLDKRGRLDGRRVKTLVDEKDLPVVSVIVPAYNEERTISKTIQSLLDLDYPREKLEVIVVNDGSVDNTRKLCGEFGSRIKLINLETNSGNKACPMNTGLKEAAGSIIGCLDADSMVDSHALKLMLPYFSDPQVAAVTPALKVWKPGNLIQKLQWFEYIFSVFLRKLMSFLDGIYVTPGPFSLYRKSVLAELGGFDENNITEDMEIALRMQSRDYRIDNVLEANVYTVAPENMTEFYRQRRRWYSGLVYNSIKYRRMILNRKYGDFGLFMMPVNLVSVLILVASTSLILYYIIKPAFNVVYQMYLVNFDFMVYLQDITTGFMLIDFDVTHAIVGVVLIGLTLVTLFLSHRYAGENMRRFGMKSLAVFVLFYFILIGFIWAVVFAGLVSPRHKKGLRGVW